MSAQHKRQENITKDQDKSDLAEKVKDQRPNIDDLLKRISVEKKQERTNNLIIMIVGIVTIAVVSLVFTQN
tara:strand:+ start:22 stop:234 length:213 start_codon:yes stop_codon:yes gene_type:complete